MGRGVKGTGKRERWREGDRQRLSIQPNIPHHHHHQLSWASKDGIKQSIKEEIRALKEGIENEAETDKEVDEV